MEEQKEDKKTEEKEETEDQREEEKYRILEEERHARILEILKGYKNKQQFADEFTWKDRERITTTKEAYEKDGKITVYKCKSKKDNEFYAIKVFNDFHRNFEPENLAEIEVLMKIRHSNLIRYQDVFWWEEENETEKVIQLAIKMEYCPNTLDTRIKDKLKSGQRFTDMELLWMLKIGLDVIEYLMNHHKISLFSIKPCNVLLDSNNEWKFSDYGMFQKSTSQMSVDYTKTSGTSSYYLAPEYLASLKIGQDRTKLSGEKCDVFSLGMIILQCYIFKGEEDLKNLNVVVDEDFILFDQKIRNILKGNRFFKPLLQKMLDGIFNNRLKAFQCKAWISKNLAFSLPIKR